MSTDDFSVIDLPRVDSVRDPRAYLRAPMRWHFGADTGSPFWLEKAKSLDFDPLTDVKSFDDWRCSPISSTNCARWLFVTLSLRGTDRSCGAEGFRKHFLMRNKGFIRTAHNGG